jgi:hypothetical protein
MCITRCQPTWRLDLVGERILESGTKGLRREDAEISFCSTEVRGLQNLKVVVLKYDKADEIPIGMPHVRGQLSACT